MFVCTIYDISLNLVRYWNGQFVNLDCVPLNKFGHGKLVQIQEYASVTLVHIANLIVQYKSMVWTSMGSSHSCYISLSKLCSRLWICDANVVFFFLEKKAKPRPLHRGMHTAINVVFLYDHSTFQSSLELCFDAFRKWTTKCYLTPTPWL